VAQGGDRGDATRHGGDSIGGLELVGDTERESTDVALAADLVRRIAAGDAKAEAELVERYSRGVLFLLRRRSGDPALADDLHQETFRVVLERLRGRGIGEPEKLAGFVRATARNLFIGEVRKRTRRKTDDDSEAVERTVDVGHGQYAEAVRAQQAAAIRELLGELGTERDREILMRFYLAEDDKEAICADLGLSSLHFNRVLHRAKQRFKEILDRERERWDAGVAKLLTMLMAVGC
jgi:RNA polymerase sigma-70 factor (ECF subfamily)